MKTPREKISRLISNLESELQRLYEGELSRLQTVVAVQAEVIDAKNKEIARIEAEHESMMSDYERRVKFAEKVPVAEKPCTSLKEAVKHARGGDAPTILRGHA